MSVTYHGDVEQGSEQWLAGPARVTASDHSTCCVAMALAFFAQLNSDPAALSQAIAAARDCEGTK